MENVLISRTGKQILIVLIELSSFLGNQISMVSNFMNPYIRLEEGPLNHQHHLMLFAATGFLNLKSYPHFYYAINKVFLSFSIQTLKILLVDSFAVRNLDFQFPTFTFTILF